ncbi:proline dehydrogenase [Paenibacillus sp. 1011MAR3C5]|uniref:proline dehydrogenase family protein n=1 Tax=Paenibacillus sp. 1011MAR3C5 TaxID=1675787 RepID=UPI000E6C21B5|nr:proline dehydrogenase family protein [Paenibacillus sp. 1011MAR3C5]RJE85117.1 proline dehydrogenase [Paenibacillus sp. 1011MAR3C5]
MTKPEVQAATALKSISRNETIKSYIRQSNELYPLLRKAALRFVTGDTREEALKAAEWIKMKGYHVAVECIGENTSIEQECLKATEEFKSLIEAFGQHALKETVSLDLSHIGLSVSSDLAYANLTELAEIAQCSGVSIMTGMEESSKTDAILQIYKKASERFPSVGVTLQAHLHRSPADLQELLHYPGKIRLVKGAYGEPAELALPRSPELNLRYLEMAAALLENEHPVSLATHDESLLQEWTLRYGQLPSHAEFEMLYGIRPERLSELRAEGSRCKVYLPYGEEWYLYVCHRIAEHPENLYRALVDIIGPSTSSRMNSYN